MLLEVNFDFFLNKSIKQRMKFFKWSNWKGLFHIMVKNLGQFSKAQYSCNLEPDQNMLSDIFNALIICNIDIKNIKWLHTNISNLYIKSIDIITLKMKSTY